MSIKSFGKKGAVVAAAMSCALMFCGAMSANAEEAGTISVKATNFYEVSTGMFPGTYSNQIRNVGNRGCNSCHEDLLDVTNATQPTHIFTNTGYDRSLTLKDCEPCHSFQLGRAGVYLGDVIHSIHYASQPFVEAMAGNCMSCHAFVSDGQGGGDIVMFDDVMYDPEMWGYPNPADTNTRFWVTSRGIGSDGYLNGAQIVANPDLGLEFSQPITAEEDCYVVDNWASIEMPEGIAYYYGGQLGETWESYSWNNCRR